MSLLSYMCVLLLNWNGAASLWYSYIRPSCLCCCLRHVLQLPTAVRSRYDLERLSFYANQIACLEVWDAALFCFFLNSLNEDFLDLEVSHRLVVASLVQRLLIVRLRLRCLALNLVMVADESLVEVLHRG